MNLYKYHSKPKQLNYYDEYTEKLPWVAWNKYFHNKNEMKQREHLWAKDAETAYGYARIILNKKWTEGEEAISKSPRFSYFYALYVLEKPFPLGEAAIASNNYWASEYMRTFNLDLVNGKFVPK